jgi:hypothetical protein
MTSRSDTKVKRLLRAGNDEVAIYVELAEDMSGLKRGRVSIRHSSHADAPGRSITSSGSYLGSS